MLNRIKLLLGIEDASKDNLLKALLSQSTTDVLNYCHILELPVELENVVVDLVIRRYNLLGQEGVESESYSDVNFKYDFSIPDFVKIQLKSYRKVQVI